MTTIMSQSFNLHRIGQLVRWSMATDRPYNVKSFGMVVIMECIFFQIINLDYFLGHGQNGVQMARVCVLAWLFSLPAAGGSYFFYSYYMWKDGIRELILLPASRLEKFVVRFLLPIFVQLVIFAVGALVADFLQHFVGFIINREPLRWVLPDVFNSVSSFFGSLSGLELFVLIILAFWVNSMYLLGANLVRNIKFNFVFTTVVLLAIYIAAMMLISNGWQFVHHQGILLSIVLIALTLLNFWLAFRLFSLRPLIGKFINKL